MSTGYLNNEHTHTMPRETALVLLLNIIKLSVKINNPTAVHFQTKLLTLKFTSTIYDLMRLTYLIAFPSCHQQQLHDPKNVTNIDLSSGERKFTTYKENA